MSVPGLSPERLKYELLMSHLRTGREPCLSLGCALLFPLLDADAELGVFWSTRPLTDDEWLAVRREPTAWRRRRPGSQVPE